MGADVLQVVTDTDRRGAQIFAAVLGDALECRGRHVRTVALAPGTSRGEHLDVPILGESRRGVRTLAALRRELTRYDVVVGFGSTTLPACALAAAGTRTPFVYRSIGDLQYWANTPVRRTRVRLLLSRAAAVVALWQEAADRLVSRFGVPAVKVHVIPRGVAADEFPVAAPGTRPAARRRFGLDPDRTTLVYLGSLSEEKSVGRLIRALGALPDCQLLVAGDGPERAELERLAAATAKDRVAFAGVVARPAEAFAAGDLAVLSSRSEGMPGVLIEAGLSGLGAVSTAVGGVADVIVPRRTGELVAPDAEPAALAAGISAALPHAADYGRAARQRCLEHFEISVVARAWDVLLADIAGAGGARRGGHEALP